MNQKLETSQTPVYVQAVSIFFGGLVIFLVTGNVLSLINNFLNIDISQLITIVRVLVFFGTALALLLAFSRSSKKKYELTDDAIVIYTSGLFSKKKMYRFANVNHMTVKQGVLGKRENYGDVIINMDRLENNVEVALRSVLDPEKVVQDINDHLVGTRRN